MPASVPGNVTQLLLALSAGDAEALNKLTPLVYPELRRLAARALRGERSGHTLDTTALVHEAYLRLVDRREVQWQHRAQFFGLAAQIMRRILVDHARRRTAAKRAIRGRQITLVGPVTATGQHTVDLTDLDEGLHRLAAFDPRPCRIVELRFFGGLTIEETAEVLGISPATVKREWAVAKAWLRRDIGRARSDNK